MLAMYPGNRDTLQTVYRAGKATNTDVQCYRIYSDVDHRTSHRSVMPKRLDVISPRFGSPCCLWAMDSDGHDRQSNHFGSSRLQLHLQRSMYTINFFSSFFFLFFLLFFLWMMISEWSLILGSRDLWWVYGESMDPKKQSDKINPLKKK